MTTQFGGDIASSPTQAQGCAVRDVVAGPVGDGPARDPSTHRSEALPWDAWVRRHPLEFAESLPRTPSLTEFLGHYPIKTNWRSLELCATRWAQLSEIERRYAVAFIPYWVEFSRQRNAPMFDPFEWLLLKKWENDDWKRKHHGGRRP